MTYQELIETKDFITYGDLLNTTEWRQKRDEILKMDSSKCTNCNNSNIYEDLSIGILRSFDASNDLVYEMIYGKHFEDKVKEHIWMYKIHLQDKDSKDAVWKNIYPNSRIIIKDTEAIQGKAIHMSYYKTDPFDLNKPIIINKVFNSKTNETVWENPKYQEFSLHIHHNFYIRGQLPWEYPQEGLRTLCRYCHNKLHADGKVPVHGKNKVLTFCSRCSGEGWLPEFAYHQQGRCFRCETACYDELRGMNLKEYYVK